MVKSILEVAYGERARCLRILKNWEEVIIDNGGTIQSVTTPSPTFLRRAAARSLSLDWVLQMSDEVAHGAFERIRWHEHGGKPHCPRCGCSDLYVCRAEHRWKCKDCSYRFSVTSETIFANHKLAIRDILAAIVIVANGEKRVSALQLSRDLDVQYRTALDLAHKIRGSTPRSTGRRGGKSGGRHRKPEGSNRLRRQSTTLTFVR